MTKMPKGIWVEFWTADEIAECLDGINDETYMELWSIVDECEKAKNYKPTGGDGSPDENGVRTFEEPQHTTSYADQPRQFWAKLTEEARTNIAEAAAAEEEKETRDLHKITIFNE